MVLITLVSKERSMSILMALSGFVGVFFFCASIFANEPEGTEQLAEVQTNQWRRESYQTAVELYEQASAEWLKVRNYRRASQALQKAARLNLVLTRNESAIANLLDSLRVLRSEKNRNIYEQERANTLSRLSLAYLKLGKERESRQSFEEALKIMSSRSDLAPKALALASAGEYYYNDGDFERALDLFRQSRDLWLQAGESQMRAQLLNSEAFTLMVMGRSSEGLKCAQEAESIYISLEDNRGVALSKIAVGHSLSAMGSKQLAMKYYAAAEELFPEDVDLVERGALINGLGFIYEAFGEWDLSVQCRERALSLYEKEEYPYGQLATLESLLKLSLLLGDDSTAEAYLERIVHLSQVLKDEHFLSLAYRHLGDRLVGKGLDVQALRFYRKSGAISSTTGYLENSALILNRIGSVLERRGNILAARDMYLKSIDISRDISDRFAEAETLYLLARLERNRNNNLEAIELVRSSLDVTESLYSDVASSQLKASFHSSVFDRYELYINLLMRMERATPGEGFSLEALRVCERARARNLLEDIQLSEARYTRDAPPESVEREKGLRSALNTKRNQLTTLLSKKAPREEAKRKEDEVRETHRQLEDLKAELKVTSPMYAAIKDPAPFDPERFRNEVLDDDSIFLEFSFGTDESYLWLIEKNEITHYTLAPRGQLELKIVALVDLLRSREHRPDESIETYNKRVSDAEQKYPGLSAELSSDLLGQVAEKLWGRRLIVSPNGKMGFLPLGALPYPFSGDPKPMAATNEIVYAPSASILSLLKALGRNERRAPDRDLLAFSDPVFSASDERLIDRTPNQRIFQESLAMMRSADSIRSLGRLPASELEARSVAAIVPDSTVISGFAANRDRVLHEDLTNYRIIHFATHGVLNEMHPDLSGILLSLYDEKGVASEGFIRSQDIYGLDLNADLVVLSACDTGIGEEIRGEGIVGLNTAFLQAGARSVVSSLWKVDDNATEKLMREFYSAMASDNLTPAQALTRAQRKMMEDSLYRSPFYWAAFSAQGDADIRIPFSSRMWFSSTTVVAICVAGVLAFWLLWQRRFGSTYSTVK